MEGETSMITTVEDLIERIDNSEYVQKNLVRRYDLIKSRDLGWKLTMVRLMNFICPNLERWIPKPNREDYVKGDALEQLDGFNRYLDAYNDYFYQNSQANFPYCKENYENLVNHIEGMRECEK